MAILCDCLPFRVSFHVPAFFNQGVMTIPVELFCDTEEEVQANSSPAEIKENVPLSLTFDAPVGSRLYMDGLDTLPSHEAIRLDEDLGKNYLTPCQELPFLKNDYYPLIPSRNLMTIIVDDRTYYAIVKVIPSQLTEDKYQIMIDDLEKMVKGLSMDLIRKNLGLGDYEQRPIPPIMLYRFMTIQKHFKSVMAALNDLVVKVNHRVKKEYHMEPAEVAKRIDSVTIRHRLTHQMNVETMKVPKRVVDYNLPENRWTKKIIKQLDRYIAEFVEAVDEYIAETKANIVEQSQFAKFQPSTRLVIEQKERVLVTLDDYRETAIKMERSLKIIKTASWYDEITESCLSAIPQGLIYDARYFALYQLYKELQREDYELALDPKYAYQYMRTDILYERWGFLKVCEVLKHESLGFVPSGGWIYDKGFNLSDSLIPTLLPGSAITLTKEDIRLNVTYDGRLPFKQETSLANPVYIVSKHRRPDGRIDIFKNDVFIGSIIFDLKYRKSSSILDEKYYGSSHTCDQLSAYASACRSPYIYNTKKRKILDGLGVVQEVWVFFPMGSDTRTFDEDGEIKFIRLIPGGSAELLTQRIEAVLKKIIDEYQEVVQG